MLFFGLLVVNTEAMAQCCSGGSGSPIAGGISQGVLTERQMEVAINTQFIQTNQFYTEDSKETEKYFDSFSSIYEYFRVAYGVTKNFSMSMETGYYFQKKETGLDDNPQSTYESQGIGDLILFPRYDVVNRTTPTTRTEVTVGLGFKIPLGSYNDSTGNVEPFSGMTYYITKPQSVQLSSGAQDIIFYTFLFRGYPLKNFRVFANGIYIKKGWNPIGEKLGDYASVGLFASKTFFENMGVTLQMRYEWVDQMELNEDILLYAYPNYDPYATGYKKVFFSPQVSYTMGKFTVYAVADIPVYQNVVKTQVATQYQGSVGVSYRFFVVNSKVKSEIPLGNYFCPMHPEITSEVPDKCPQCGMDLELKK
jgi:Heavy metal binding domain